MEKSVSQAVEDYLSIVKQARSANTARSYTNALRLFCLLLNTNHSSPTAKNKKSDSNPPDVRIKKHTWIVTARITELHEDEIISFIDLLKEYSPATEQLYITAVAGFFEYLAAENLTNPNLPRLRLLIKQRSRRPGQRLPQFPREHIDYIVDYAIKIDIPDVDNLTLKLIALRDRALIITLADTGLRIHEVCNLRRGDLDWNEGKALVIGKGNRESVVRFSKRSLSALKDYLAARSGIDGASGRPLPSLPLFVRHDKGSGRNLKAISTRTGWNIVRQRVIEAVGVEASGSITPHSFRHYFVTTVLRASGGNLKLAQELARHKNIAVTQRYAHLSDDELDRGYFSVFDEK